MTEFAGDACFYGLLFVGFLGVEAQRQRRGGSLPTPARQIHVASAGLLLVLPLVLGFWSGGELSAGEQIACALAPFALMILFCALMAARAAWRERCERREREDVR